MDCTSIFDNAMLFILKHMLKIAAHQDVIFNLTCRCLSIRFFYACKLHLIRRAASDTAAAVDHTQSLSCLKL